MALVDMGLGAAILANLCTNGVAGRTSACVSMIIWDWKMKMWGNLGTGPGACALCGGWPRLSEGGLGDACGSMLVRSVLVAIIRAGPSGTCVLMVLRSVRLKCSSYWLHYFNFNFFFYKAKGLKQPVAGGGRAWWSPRLTKPFCRRWPAPSACFVSGGGRRWAAAQISATSSLALLLFSSAQTCSEAWK